MGDPFREVTSVSWFGRIRNALAGVLVGLAVVLAMVAVLFWNEGRAVTTARSLAEGARSVVSVPAASVDRAYEGRLIHVSGPLTASEGLVDEDFGVAAKGVRLVRTVEMFQWVEHSKSETTTKVGGGEETVTTYSYAKEWQGRPVSSAEFKQPQGHENPPMGLESRSFQIKEASLGAFVLRKPVLDLVGDSDTLVLPSSQEAATQDAFTGSQRVSISDGRIVLGANPAAPAIGDYRIGYRLVPLGEVSVVGKQQATGLAPYQTLAGDKLLMVDIGAVPADKMFANSVAANTIVTWLLRAGCLVLLAVGFGLVLSPLGVLADVIPFVGSIVRMGTVLIAFVLALLVGTATISVAWFWYRPALAAGIAIAGLAVALVLMWIGRRRAAAAPGAGAAA